MESKFGWFFHELKVFVLNPIFRYYLYWYLSRNNKLGKNVSIASGVLLKNSKVGDFCAFGPDSRVVNSEIGKCSYLSSSVKVSGSTIGCFCSIGPNSIIAPGMHPVDFISTHPAFYSPNKQCGFSFSDNAYFVENKQVKIGSDVWIGANSLVLDGVTIGDGAIVAACSVVTKDIPPYAIVAGIPAKIIRFRFSDGNIGELMKIKWWNWDIPKISERSVFFRDGIDQFIDEFRSNGS